MKHAKIVATAIIFMLVVVASAFGVTFFHPMFLTSSTPHAELGEPFDPKSNLSFVFLAGPDKVTVDGTVDTAVAGDYQITYRLNHQTETVNVTVSDTQAPELTPKTDFKVDMVQAIAPADLVQEVKEASEYTLSFKGEPDLSAEGMHEVTIIAADALGNESSTTASFTRVADTQAPEIALLPEVTVKQGESTDFVAGLTATDDFDPAPVIEADTSSFDGSVPGTTTVKIVARDRSGNEAVFERTVIVEENPEYGKKVVYLTFDDGPSANTKRVIDILARYNAKATFFVTGNNQSYNYLIKEAHDAGHAIGLHTYTHNYAQVYASDDAFFADLQQISDMVEGIIGEKSMLTRFPGGSSNTVSANYNTGIMSRLVDALPARGYQYFDWNVSSSDASGNNVATEKIIASSTASSAEKIVLLFHDTAAKDTTVEALPTIIEHYKAQGYVFLALTHDSYAAHHGVNN